jgi:hypothetical protein
MKMQGLFAVCLFICFSGDNTLGQEELISIRIMFWNVENFFDPFDDSLKIDDEFTPRGNRGWTWVRFNKKLNNIYKVIMSEGWKPPDIIGLCEVENRWVLEQLTGTTPLGKFEYRIIHHDSPDQRGIDVAMLYLPSSFRPLRNQFIPVTGLKTNDDPTRDILFIKGIIKTKDTVNIFVNHWPSRYPGQAETSHKRNAAASVLRRNIDSLFNAEPGCKIIIMGDFNDEPRDESISEILGVAKKMEIQSGAPGKMVQGNEQHVHSGENVKTKSGVAVIGVPDSNKESSPDEFLKTRPGTEVDSIPGDATGVDELYSLSPPVKRSITGTLKFEGRWYLFDQFMISGGLLAVIGSFKTEIVDHDFLLKPDEAYTGQKAFSTYNGYIYQGGYSDHLPVVMEMGIMK